MANTMRKITLLFIFLLVSTSGILAQSLRAYIQAADNAFMKKDYFTALVYYKKVLEVNPERNDLHFKYAESARLFQAYRIAEDAYHKITLSKDSMNFPLATYWLGSVKKNLGKYEEASQVLTTYLKKHKRINTRFSKRAEKDIVDCNWAAKVVRSSTQIKATPLGGGVNSPYSEFGGIEMDGTLYFSSMRFHEKGKGLYSKLMKRDKDGVLESFDFNTEEKFAANATLSFDGNRMYYTNCAYNKKGDIQCAIVYRDKKYNDVWGAEQSLPSFINFPGFTATHPSIGYDKINNREVLFFSSNRPGGKGKLDIWYSTVAPNGKFTRPTNHSFLNTRDNDVTPFFHSPTQTLYFSSDGYSGMGGYDIYKVKREGRSWQIPIHMSYPINTSYNDFYFTLNENGTQSYFSSNREEAMEIDPENEACCNDIFTANLQADKIKLTTDEFLALTKSKEATYVEVEEYDDPPRVIMSTPNPNESEPEPGYPETIIGEKPTLVVNENNSSIDIIKNPSTNPSQESMGEKGSNPVTEESSSTSSSTETNSNNTSPNSNIEFEKDFDKLPRDIFSLVFQVEILDWNLEPLKGTTVKFIEESRAGNRKNFKKNNIAGNVFKFRIKDHVNYKIIVSKPGYQIDSFVIDKELLIGATELSQTFYMSELESGSFYPDSPIEELNEPVVTESMLNSFLPLQLYFDNNEPDPTSWSNTTNKNYEQTFLIYHSRKEIFKNKYARKFASSQREEALNNVDYFFKNELKKGYQDLFEFSNQAYTYLKKGNKLTIVFQPYISSKSSNSKSTALIKRRISCLNNHFRSHLAGKLVPFMDAGFLEFKILDPIAISANTKGTYSPESSRLRKIEIKLLRFNDF